MPLINVTAADIAKLQNLEAGWYSAECVKIEQPKAAAKGTSINYRLVFLIKGEKAKGKEITVVINSQLLGKIAPIYDACFYPEKFNAGQVDLDLFMNKECDVKVAQRNFEGQLMDEIQGWLPKGTSAAMTVF